MLEENVYRIDPDEVVVEERQRKKIKQSTLGDLAKSIQEIGQLHPAVCHRGEDGKIRLIAGERRLRACQHLKIPFSYTLREEITDPRLLRQIELEENLRREDLDWMEEVQAKKELHELYQEKYGTTTSGKSGGHGLADTADKLGESIGLISGDIELAMWAKAVKEVADAPNKTTAKKIIDRLKKGVDRSILLKKALKVMDESEVDDSEDAEEYTYVVERDPETGITHTVVKALQAKPKPDRLLQEMLITYDKKCKLGKMEAFLAGGVADEWLDFDIVLFDPPWGVDFDRVSLDDGTKEKYQDNRRSFIDSLEDYLKLIYDCMSENSHLYMFFGIVHYQLVYDTLEQVGFKTNRIPILWHKKGSHRTRNPEIWPGRCYEPIAFARKGYKPLYKQGAADIIETPLPSPTLKQDHPSAKHPDIYIELLRRSASPGDKVLDPMGGSGMSAVACEYLRGELGLNWTLIEEKETFRDLTLMNLIKGYDELVKFKYTAPTDFRELNPGSTEWMNFWNAHPEEQPAMLAWMNEEEKEEE